MTKRRLLAALLLLSAPANAAESAARPIRFLIPNAPFSLDSQKELADVVNDYNRDHPGTPVQLVRRGDNFSSLRELMAMHLAGDAPDIAAVECSEFPAIDEIALARTLPPELVARLVVPEGAAAAPASRRRAAGKKRLSQALAGAKKGEPQPPHKIFTLPFERVVPILVADQEMLFRVHADPDRLPTTWKGIIELSRSLASVLGSPASSASGVLGSPAGGAAATGAALAQAGERYALALPLQGSRGLWLFEALAGRPLWTRLAGGLKSNRELEPAIEEIRSAIDRPGLSRAEETWDRAVQDFVDRRSPLLATSSDMLPYIAKQAGFRWTTARLPDLPGGERPLEGGADLIVTRSSPEILGFLEFLYSPRATARWAKSGAFYPLRGDWERSPLWKLPRLALRSRTTDTDVVRAHTEWVSALHFLFGEKAKRLPPETVFTQLDTELALGSQGK